MPEYIITDPKTGRKIKIKGDSAPTEQEIETLFAIDKPSERKQQTVPKAEGKLPQINRGIATGLGSFVDILNLGIGAEDPFAGAKSFIRGFENLGLPVAKKEPTDLIGRSLNVLGDLATGGIPAGAIMRGGKEPIKQLVKSFPTKAVPPEPVLSPTIQKFADVLKGSKRLGRKQKDIIREGRQAKVEESLKLAEKNLSGEELAAARANVFKGEFEKVEFEPLQKFLKGDEKQELFDVINKSDATEFEKLSASNGLWKLLEGNRPFDSQIELLEELYGVGMLKDLQGKRSLFQKISAGFKEAINIPKAMRATLDFSAALRQGVFLAAGRPKQFGGAFKDMFKFAFDEKAYDGFFKGLKQHPKIKLIKDSNLSITNLGKDLSKREEAIMSHLPEKIPTLFGGGLIRGSNRAYTGFLNKLRVDTFSSMVDAAKARGIKVDDKLGKQIANYVNTATGRGDLFKFLDSTKEVLNGLIFSPRLVSSRLKLLSMPFDPRTYTQLDPFVRKQYAKDALSFVAAGSSVLALAHVAGAEVGTESTSSDYGQIKVGNTRYDVWGGFRPYVVALSRIFQQEKTNAVTGRKTSLGENTIFQQNNTLGVLENLSQGKLSPSGAFVHGALSGNKFGDEFRPTAEAVDLVIPLILEDIKDLAQEGDAGKAIVGSVLAAFGVGVNTFGDKIPTRTEKGIKFRNEPTIGEFIVNSITGDEVSNLTQSQQKRLQARREREIKRRVELENRKRGRR